MGNFRIEIDACGGHGCKREIKDGQISDGCGEDSCPDCMARRFVQSMKARGFFNYPPSASARLIHWPGEPCSVEDDLLTGRRKGNF